ncbi:unnamed protein product [Amoebophrya sp. A25]|nr:unnamed protein product [Amoebophrya sp. A25]|eukprot:GSA25T00006927001.1
MAERALKQKVVKLDETEALRAEYTKKFNSTNHKLCKERFERFWIASEFLRLQEKYELLMRKEQRVESNVREKELLLKTITKKNEGLSQENKQMYSDYVKLKVSQDKMTQTELVDQHQGRLVEKDLDFGKWAPVPTKLQTWETQRVERDSYSGDGSATAAKVRFGGASTRPRSASGVRGLGGGGFPAIGGGASTSTSGGGGQVSSGIGIYPASASSTGIYNPSSGSGTGSRSNMQHADFVSFLCKILFSFVRENNIRMVKESVTHLNDLNHKDLQGDTLLSICCKEDKPDLLRYFLAIPEKWGGAAMLQKELNDGRILSLATQSNFASDVIAKLLSSQADPNYKVVVPPKPTESLFARKPASRQLEAPLVYAVANNSERVVKQLLIAGADPNFFYQTSSLRWAIRSDNGHMVNLLLRADADIISEERELLREADSEKLRDFIRRTIVNEKYRLGRIVDQALLT